MRSAPIRSWQHQPARMGLALAMALVLLGSAPSPLFAAPPDMNVLMEKMKAALEPARPSTRKIIMAVTSEGKTVEWTAAQARKKLPDGKRVLTVALAPEGIQGVALLDWERAKPPQEQWIYLPALRRVRKIFPVTAFQPFLDTDFTYYDLGFVELDDRGFTFLAEETHDGVRSYKVQQIPNNPWYYSRIVTWVAADTFHPLERDYYDPGKQLWKVERFENITTIDGVPTALKIVMKDVQQGGSSELRVSHVRYDVVVPDDIFKPGFLPKAASHPLWEPLRQ
jgi:hypothetical protein